MLRRFRAAAIGVAALATMAFQSGEATFAPSSDLWDRWTKHDAISTAVVDYSDWTAWLKRHLVSDPSGVSLIGYAGVSPDETKELDTIVARLASLPVDHYNRQEQFAYWINLYNALTVKTVLDHYPVESIRDIDISPGFFSNGPWGAKLIDVAGERLSLNDIEHRILRPIWNDARIHYGVNCAAIGCPNLAPVAYSGAKIDAQLDASARAYINNPRGVRFRSGDRIVVSRIYDWFFEDFSRADPEKAIIAHLLEYAEPDLAARIRAIGKLDSTEYDWRLNDAKLAGELKFGS